jgi:antitoxin Phd
MPLSTTLKLEQSALPRWQLQDAKNRFSALVKAAAGGVAQVVTVHGQPAAVVLSAHAYERLLAAATASAVQKQSLSQALRCPELDLADEALFARSRAAEALREPAP